MFVILNRFHETLVGRVVGNEPNVGCWMLWGFEVDTRTRSGDEKSTQHVVPTTTHISIHSRLCPNDHSQTSHI